MGKYEPLAAYLKDRKDDVWDARFSEVETVLGFALPKSAHEYPAWWANQDGAHSQTKGWRGAGWETEKVNLPCKRVRFVRRRARRSSDHPKGPEPDSQSPSAVLVDLLGKASALSGIRDRDEVTIAALRAFIRREAGRRLIDMGGTMPDAWAPDRRRFD